MTGRQTSSALTWQLLSSLEPKIMINRNRPIKMSNAGACRSSPFTGMDFQVSGLHICIIGSVSLPVGMPDGVSPGPRAINPLTCCHMSEQPGTSGLNRDFRVFGCAVLLNLK